MASRADAASPRFDRTAAAILDAAARVFYEEGTTANLTAVAAAAGIGRATLYRYYANREALLSALSARALEDAAQRLDDAGLERASVPEAIERILRAFVGVGERYAVLLSDKATMQRAHAQLAGPVQAVLARGVETGVLRDDLPPGVLYELLAGVIVSAIKLTQQHQLGLEEASAAAASTFLDGSRRRSAR